MPNLVNGLIRRSLICERLSAAAATELQKVGMNDVVHDDPGAKLAYSVVSRTPSDWAQRLASTAKPFSNLSDLTAWHSGSIDGVARSLALVNEAFRAPCLRRPRDMRVEWRYETAVLYLNQIYVESIKYLAAEAKRVDA